MIKVENLTKFYGDNPALQGLSFHIEAGEIIGLVGKNGAGKSTALRILCAQLLPSGGTVSIDGISVTEDPAEVRGKIGYLPEVAPLYREMKVTSFLQFVGRLRRISGEKIAERLEGVIRETGLAEVAGEQLGKLSRGYQQRVGIAQAIIHRPPVILLDEPMSGLDPLQIVQIRDLILSLRKNHTILFSSHILSEITNVCDRVILIDQGAVKAEGTERELREFISPWRNLTLLARGSEGVVMKAIHEINGVSSLKVSVREEGLIQVRIVCQKDLREAVSSACLKAGLGLLELKSDSQGLEDLFMQLVGDRREEAS